jgi:thiaminase (transcriptional activator TenA)
MKFTETLWDDIGHIYEAILELPFNKELMNGTLPEDVFAFYMKQDALYLEDFSRALAIAGAKSDSAAELKNFLDFATGAVIVERALHDSFLKKFNTHIDVGKSPACFSYTNFLLSAASNEDYPVAVAALLPCFWIYREVGHHILRSAAGNNAYQDWIDTYAGEEFSESVNKMIEITDHTAHRSSGYQRDKMKRAFVYSTKLEWMFWDSAYKKEEWPV